MPASGEAGGLNRGHEMTLLVLLVTAAALGSGRYATALYPAQGRHTSTTLPGQKEMRSSMKGRMDGDLCGVVVVEHLVCNGTGG